MGNVTSKRRNASLSLCSKSETDEAFVKENHEKPCNLEYATVDRNALGSNSIENQLSTEKHEYNKQTDRGSTPKTEIGSVLMNCENIVTRTTKSDNNQITCPQTVDFVLSTEVNSISTAQSSCNDEINGVENITPFVTNVPPPSTLYKQGIRSLDNAEHLVNGNEKEATIEKCENLSLLHESIKSDEKCKDTRSVTTSDNSFEMEKEPRSDATHDDSLEMETVPSEMTSNNSMEANKEPRSCITFDDSLIYKVLEKYYQRVKQDLRNRNPLPEVLEMSQRSLRGMKNDVPRTDGGIPFPVPYIWDKVGEEATSGKVCPSISSLAQTIKWLEHQPTTYDKLNSIFDTVLSVTTVDSITHTAKEIGIDTTDSAVDFHILFFKYLCDGIGIPCIIVEGYKRMLPSNKKFDWSNVSQWLAVLHEDKWKLVDPHPVDRKTWQSVNCLSMGTSYRRASLIDYLFRRNLDKLFFANPVEFISDHFPQKSYWQLLLRPVSREEWDNMVYFTPIFYELNLRIKSVLPFCLDMEGERHKTIKLSYQQTEKLQFAAKLYSYNGQCLDRAGKSWTYVEADTGSGICIIKVCPPQDAILKIYALHSEKASVYSLVCCVNIKATKDNDSENLQHHGNGTIGFPRNIHRFEWGPANDTVTCGLIPISYQASELRTSENTVFITFKRIKDDYTYDFNIEKAFADDNYTISRRFVFFWYESDCVTYRISNPFKGGVIFNVLKKETYSSHNASVCSYYIHFLNEPFCNCVPPFVDSGRLGITKYGRKEKILFTDCVNGIIKSTSSGEVTLRLQNHSTVIVTPRLHFMSACFHDMLRHVFITNNDALLMIRLNLPRRGDYLLSLFSSADDSDSQCLFNGLISVKRPSFRWSPYPELCMDHKYNVGIFSPKSGIIAAKQDMYFSVEIPNSVDVAAVSCKGWTHLDQTSENIWEGLVTTGYAGTEVKIMARFQIGSDEFFRLLTYKVI